MHIRNPLYFTRTLCGAKPTAGDLDYRLDSVSRRVVRQACSKCFAIREAAEAEGYEPPQVEPPEVERLHRVFVYGTLRAGMRNHKWLNGAPLVPSGGITYAACYLMLSVSDAFPGVIRGGKDAVVGEVYLVDQKTLEALDRHEGCPTHYRREPIMVAGINEPCWAYIYQMPTNARCAPSRVVRGADWVKYIEAVEAVERGAR